jgi:hypothetical protein
MWRAQRARDALVCSAQFANSALAGAANAASALSAWLWLAIVAVSAVAVPVYVRSAGLSFDALLSDALYVCAAFCFMGAVYQLSRFMAKNENSRRAMLVYVSLAGLCLGVSQLLRRQYLAAVVAVAVTALAAWLVVWVTGGTAPNKPGGGRPSERYGQSAVQQALLDSGVQRGGPQAEGGVSVGLRGPSNPCGNCAINTICVLFCAVPGSAASFARLASQQSLAGTHFLDYIIRRVAWMLGHAAWPQNPGARNGAAFDPNSPGDVNDMLVALRSSGAGGTLHDPIGLMEFVSTGLNNASASGVPLLSVAATSAAGPLYRWRVPQFGSMEFLYPNGSVGVAHVPNGIPLLLAERQSGLGLLALANAADVGLNVAPGVVLGTARLHMAASGPAVPPNVLIVRVADGHNPNHQAQLDLTDERIALLGGVYYLAAVVSRVGDGQGGHFFVDVRVCGGRVGGPGPYRDSDAWVRVNDERLSFIKRSSELRHWQTHAVMLMLVQQGTGSR